MIVRTGPEVPTTPALTTFIIITEFGLYVNRIGEPDFKRGKIE